MAEAVETTKHEEERRKKPKPEEKEDKPQHQHVAANKRATGMTTGYTML
jgi:hypothetical protein